jgi:nucleotidyltransferase/DNA polymerase involved in DNA repair
MAKAERKLRNLAGVGPAIEADFHLLGINTVEALAAADPDRLYEDLCTKTGTRQDPCVLDTFRCAVAQARNPDLPTDQRSWWWWSRQRKQHKADSVHF